MGTFNITGVNDELKKNQLTQPQEQPAKPMTPQEQFEMNVGLDKAYYDKQRATTENLYDTTLDNAIDKQEAISQSYIDRLSGIVKDAEDRRRELEFTDESARKRARSAQVINSIGDGFSALSNLFATTRGATPSEQSSSTTKYRAIYDDAKAKRDKLYQDNEERLRKLRDSKSDAELEHGLKFSNARANWQMNRDNALAALEKEEKDAYDKRLKERQQADADAADLELRRDQLHQQGALQRERIQAQAQRDAIKRLNNFDKNRKLVKVDLGDDVSVEIAEHRLEQVVRENKDQLKKVADQKIDEKMATLQTQFADDEALKAAAIASLTAKNITEENSSNKRAYRKAVEAEMKLIKNSIGENIRILRQTKSELNEQLSKNPAKAFEALMQYAKDIPDVVKAITKASEEDANTRADILRQVEESGINLEDQGYYDNNAPSTNEDGISMKYEIDEDNDNTKNNNATFSEEQYM